MLRVVVYRGCPRNNETMLFFSFQFLNKTQFQSSIKAGNRILAISSINDGYNLARLMVDDEGNFFVAWRNVVHRIVTGVVSIFAVFA